MSQKRFNKVFGIFGDRGTGKTEFVKGGNFGLTGIVNLYLQRGMKVIVVDTIDHPSWRHINAISPDQFPKFTKGACRMITAADNVPRLNYLLNASEATWNSAIIYEDARKHTYKNVDRSMIRLIGDSKQKNIDIGFMYHCFAHCPPDLYRYFDYIELFKTKDSPLTREKMLAGDMQEIMSIYNSVKVHPSRYYHQTIDLSVD